MARLTQGIIGLVNKVSAHLEDWALTAWAWGPAAPWIFRDRQICGREASRPGGHSRYGKATVVAWRMTAFRYRLRQLSGEGGVKLHRRNWGELVENLAAQTNTTGWPAPSSNMPDAELERPAGRFE